jgi:hypothetical protein
MGNLYRIPVAVNVLGLPVLVRGDKRLLGVRVEE